MATTGSLAKEKIKQELKVLVSALASQFETARTSRNSADLEALRILAEGKGTCRFKVTDWTDPVYLNGGDEKTVLLQTFLLLLWQNGTLEKASYDPIDLRIAKEKVVSSPKENSQSKSIKEAITENAQESGIEVATAEVEKPPKEEIVGVEEQEEEEIVDEDVTTKDIPWEVLLAEDGTNYLVGPREIRLQRKDFYHPLFSTFRKSVDIRQENFLASKHLMHVRKLSGIDVSGFGYNFCRTVLEKAASSVEELNVRHPRLSELDLYLDLQFPRLHRLYIWISEHCNIQDESHFQFPVPLQDNVGLRWLCARLPRSALESLLRHNAKTLVELQVEVGTGSYNPPSFPMQGDDRPPSFPMQCDDLEVLLAECSLSSLRKLTLIRCEGPNHSRADCEVQVEAVRRRLPGVTVLCDKCCISDKSCGIDYSIDYYYPRSQWETY